MFHKKYIFVNFLALIAVFIFVLMELFVPTVRGLFKGSVLFLLPFIIFSLLGIVLIFLTIKEKIQSKLRDSLLLIGISSAGFFISIFLHNIFYGLAVISERVVVLSYLMKFFDISFFVIAIFACPLLFLISAIITLILFLKIKFS
ncbi:MAG: hypothetical protein Q8N58_02510 [bacterium]|nr:hypothetical protein [bacterium]